MKNKYKSLFSNYIHLQELYLKCIKYELFNFEKFSILRENYKINFFFHHNIIKMNIHIIYRFPISIYERINNLKYLKLINILPRIYYDQNSFKCTFIHNKKEIFIKNFVPNHLFREEVKKFIFLSRELLKQNKKREMQEAKRSQDKIIQIRRSTSPDKNQEPCMQRPQTPLKRLPPLPPPQSSKPSLQLSKIFDNYR